MKINVNYGNELIYDRLFIKFSLEISENLCCFYFFIVCLLFIVCFNKDGMICLLCIVLKNFLI